MSVLAQTPLVALMSGGGALVAAEAGTASTLVVPRRASRGSGSRAMDRVLDQAVARGDRAELEEQIVELTKAFRDPDGGTQLLKQCRAIMKNRKRLLTNLPGASASPTTHPFTRFG